MSKLKIDYAQLGQYINDKITFEEVNTPLKYAFLKHNDIDLNTEISSEIEEAFKQECNSVFFVNICQRKNQINLFRRLSYLGLLGLLGVFFTLYFFNTGIISYILGSISSFLCIAGLTFFVISHLEKIKLTYLFKCYKCIDNNKNIEKIELEENLDLCDIINQKKSIEEINSIQKYIYSKLEEEENFVDFCRKEVFLTIKELMKDSKILFWYGLIFTLLGIFSCLGSFFLANSNLSIVNNVTNNTIASNNSTLINIPVFITSIAYSIICIVIGICMIVSSRKKKSNAFILYKALKQK